MHVLRCQGMPKLAGGVPMPCAWHGAQALDAIACWRDYIPIRVQHVSLQGCAPREPCCQTAAQHGIPMGRLELLRQPTPIRLSWAWQDTTSRTHSSNRAGYHDVQAHSTALTVAASDAKRLTCQHSSLAMHCSQLCYTLYSVYQPVWCWLQYNR